MDGTPTLRMNEFMLASLAANKIDLGPARTASTGANLAAPTELQFELDMRCRGYIDEACKHFDALVGQEEMQVRMRKSDVCRLTRARWCTTRGMART